VGLSCPSCRNLARLVFSLPVSCESLEDGACTFASEAFRAEIADWSGSETCEIYGIKEQ